MGIDRVEKQGVKDYSSGSLQMHPVNGLLISLSRPRPPSGVETLFSANWPRPVELQTLPKLGSNHSTRLSKCNASSMHHG